MVKILVAVADYPSENDVKLMYVHTRNTYYKAHGIDVTVLNFKANSNYTYDGIKVLTLNEYYENEGNYDLLVCHAPNLRKHYMFLNKEGSKFKHFVFFFHGHEVLKCKETYSRTYKYVKKEHVLLSIIQPIYDAFKLRVWKHYYRRVIKKADFVFVSRWMLNRFVENIGISESELYGKYHIIPNCIGKTFESSSYVAEIPKKYDFITIRNNLDGSKYAIDLVVNWAKRTPERQFLIIGKGRFFDYFDKPDNVTWLNRTMIHSEIVEVLNTAKCALMPTRTDAQGVMMCEMASFGIPLITSNIEVCREIKDRLGNVVLIENSKDVNMNESLQEALRSTVNDRESYFAHNTVGKEVELIERYGKQL